MKKFDHIFYSETVWSPNNVVSGEKFFYEVIRSLDRAKIKHEIKHEIKQREHYDFKWNGSFDEKIVVGITFDICIRGKDQYKAEECLPIEY